MKFEAVDGCPAPAKLAPALRRIKKRSGITYTSIYRGSDPGAAAILKRFGKATQAWLYRAYWILHLPGYRPANPPGFSTHELFNDGVAYRMLPRGAPLRYYMVGIDSTSGAAFVEAAKVEGFTASVTYPGNPLESQHANFRKEPKIKIFRSLKRGSRSTRVIAIRRRLAYVRDPHTGKPYLASSRRPRGSQLFFDGALERALKEFQRDHKQKADGVYGVRTARQLNASVAFRKRKDKEKK